MLIWQYAHVFIKKLIVLIDNARPVVLGGDARCDSPGYSAKYGSYTLMDLVTKKILDFQLVQVCMSNFSYVEIKLMKYCCE